MFRINVTQLSETIPPHRTTGDQKMHSEASADLHISIPRAASYNFKYSCLNYVLDSVSAILSTQKQLQVSSSIRLKVQSQKPHTSAHTAIEYSLDGTLNLFVPCGLIEPCIISDPNMASMLLHQLEFLFHNFSKPHSSATYSTKPFLITLLRIIITFSQFFIPHLGVIMVIIPKS